MITNKVSNKSPIAARAREENRHPYSTMAEMDLMHYHHVQRSNDASTAFDRVRGNEKLEYDRFNLGGGGFYDGAIYPDGSILTLVSTPISGLKLLAVSKTDIDEFSGFTPEMQRQINATSTPFTY